MSLLPMTHADLTRPAAVLTIRGAIKWGVSELHNLTPQEAQDEILWAIEELLGIHRTQVFLRQEEKIELAIFDKFSQIMHRRQKGEPMAYILRKSYFYEECLEVASGCLIPRPETEILVNHFIETSGFLEKDSFTLLDLGTGSGAIAVALLRKFPNARMTLSDVSIEALALAENNLKTYNLLNRSELIHSNYFEALEHRTWNAIVSNPPYLSEKDFETLQPELKFEPKEALRGGKDGLDFYRRLSAELSTHLKPYGFFALEVGQYQAEKVKSLFENQNFSGITLVKDLSGIQRVISAKKNKHG